MPVVTKNNKNKENILPCNVRKAKPAPDFSKLHKQWDSKLQKGKAVAKKPLTDSQPFQLSTTQKCNSPKIEHLFQVDKSSTNSILNCHGITQQNVGRRATIADSKRPLQRNAIPRASFNAKINRNSFYSKAQAADAKTPTRKKKIELNKSDTPLNNTNHKSSNTVKSSITAKQLDSEKSESSKTPADTLQGFDVGFKIDNDSLKSILNCEGLPFQNSAAKKSSIRFGPLTKHKKNDRAQPFPRISISASAGGHRATMGALRPNISTPVQQASNQRWSIFTKNNFATKPDLLTWLKELAENPHNKHNKMMQPESKINVSGEPIKVEPVNCESMKSSYSLTLTESHSSSKFNDTVVGFQGSLETTIRKPLADIINKPSIMSTEPMTPKHLNKLSSNIDSTVKKSILKKDKYSDMKSSKTYFGKENILVNSEFLSNNMKDAAKFPSAKNSAFKTVRWADTSHSDMTTELQTPSFKHSLKLYSPTHDLLSSSFQYEQSSSDNLPRHSSSAQESPNIALPLQQSLALPLQQSPDFQLQKSPEFPKSTSASLSLHPSLQRLYQIPYSLPPERPDETQIPHQPTFLKKDTKVAQFPIRHKHLKYTQKWADILRAEQSNKTAIIDQPISRQKNDKIYHNNSNTFRPIPTIKDNLMKDLISFSDEISDKDIDESINNVRQEISTDTVVPIQYPKSDKPQVQPIIPEKSLEHMSITPLVDLNDTSVLNNSRHFVAAPAKTRTFARTPYKEEIQAVAYAKLRTNDALNGTVSYPSSSVKAGSTEKISKEFCLKVNCGGCHCCTISSTTQNCDQYLLNSDVNETYSNKIIKLTPPGYFSSYSSNLSSTDNAIRLTPPGYVHDFIVGKPNKVSLSKTLTVITPSPGTDVCDEVNSPDLLLSPIESYHNDVFKAHELSSRKEQILSSRYSEIQPSAKINHEEISENQQIETSGKITGKNSLIKNHGITQSNKPTQINQCGNVTSSPIQHGHMHTEQPWSNIQHPINDIVLDELTNTQPKNPADDLLQNISPSSKATPFFGFDTRLTNIRLPSMTEFPEKDVKFSYTAPNYVTAPIHSSTILRPSKLSSLNFDLLGSTANDSSISNSDFKKSHSAIYTEATLSDSINMLNSFRDPLINESLQNEPHKTVIQPSRMCSSNQTNDVMTIDKINSGKAALQSNIRISQESNLSNSSRLQITKVPIEQCTKEVNNDIRLDYLPLYNNSQTGSFSENTSQKKEEFLVESKPINIFGASNDQYGSNDEVISSSPQTISKEKMSRPTLNNAATTKNCLIRPSLLSTRLCAESEERPNPNHSLEKQNHPLFRQAQFPLNPFFQNLSTNSSNRVQSPCINNANNKLLKTKQENTCIGDQALSSACKFDTFSSLSDDCTDDEDFCIVLSKPNIAKQPKVNSPVKVLPNSISKDSSPNVIKHYITDSSAEILQSPSSEVCLGGAKQHKINTPVHILHRSFAEVNSPNNPKGNNTSNTCSNLTLGGEESAFEYMPSRCNVFPKLYVKKAKIFSDERKKLEYITLLEDADLHAVLDAEIAVCSKFVEIKKMFQNSQAIPIRDGAVNPVSSLLTIGDDMHFVPVC